MSDSTATPTTATGTLGTFGGVFTPSILTILGLVLFLRVPYVVGSVGLVNALLILALSTAVSVLTSISLAVVATNMRVGGGGEYYLISRTLGVEFGGAIGVVLYLAISVSIAFYAIGFAEAVVAALDRDSTFEIQLIAAGLVLLLGMIAFIGADLATRLQFLVMALLVMALVSFFVGSIGDFSSSQLDDNLTNSGDDVGFWEAFAIFFPAVTGFSQGVAMSGDLRTPSKSITEGTFGAVGVSTVVYLFVIVLLAGGATAQVLVDDTATIMGDLSIVSWTMLVGVLAATLSSALASTLGAPRVLQRLGQDRVLPRLDAFATGSGPANNPRRALGVSLIVALATVAFGDLNAIAPIISMFFLASYGMINYATYFEMRAGSTSFRPRFRWGDHRASLAGTIACAGAIIAINPVAGAVSAAVLIALYTYLRHRDVPDRWVDSAGSHHYTKARQHLRALAGEPPRARDWRPCILSFVPRDPTNRRRMITMSSWLEGDAGFLTAVRIVEGSGPVMRRQADQVEFDFQDEVDEIVDGAFARTLLAGDQEIGVQSLVQSHGIGPVRANLTVFGARDLRGSESDRQSYGSMLQNCVRFGTNVAVVNVRDDAWATFEATPRDERTIALWWSDDQVGQLITLLGWLCTRHREWRRASIVVYVPDVEGSDETARVEALIDASRIAAKVVAVEQTPASFATAMSGATLALAPLRVSRGTALGPFGSPLGMLLESLPLAIMLLATEELELTAEPDESQLAELARARDQAAEAAKWVADLDAQAAGLLVAAEELRIQAEVGSDDEATAAALEQADADAAAAYRRYVDARARQARLDEHVAELERAHPTVATDPDIWRSASAAR